MKTKLTAFLCAAAMLITLLTGCGSAAPETTPETKASETQPPETTAATLAAAEPMEPKTFFEEQGLTLWENTVYKGSEKAFNERGVPVKPNSNSSSVYGTEGTIDEFHLAMIAYPNEKESEIISKNIVKSDLNVSVWEYYSKNFNVRALKEVINAFYNARTDTDMSKEEWLSKHEDYKIIQCQMKQYVNTSEQIDEGNAHGADWCTVTWENPSIVDMADGMVFMSPDIPADENHTPVGHFTLSHDGINQEIYAVRFSAGEWLHNSKSNGLGDLSVCTDCYVLVPENYDELAFVYPDLVELAADEEYIGISGDEEDPIWVAKEYSEYVSELDRYELLYFGMMK